jgi:hypothetical protein
MALEYVSVTNAALGIDNKTGAHQASLTDIEADTVRILTEEAQGINNAISGEKLADLIFYTDNVDQGTRNVRYLVNHLIVSHKIPNCSMPGKDGGYFLPLTKEEETVVYNARKKRAITGLVKMSQGRKNALVDSAEQLVLFMDDPDNAKAIERLKLSQDEGPVPAWVQLVTRLLDKLSGTRSAMQPRCGSCRNSSATSLFLVTRSAAPERCSNHHRAAQGGVT